MLIVNRPRRAGKTWAIVSTAIDFKHRILVFSEQEKERLYKTYPKLEGGQVVTIEDIRSGKTKGDRRFEGISIDNLDMILERWLQEPIIEVSITDGGCENA